MESFVAGLALVIVGLVGAFFGYRLFRILLPIYGAVAGFVLAWGWWGESAWLLALVVGVTFAVILAIAAYTIWSAFIGIAGVVFGVALASLIATTFNLWTWLAFLLAAALGVAFGILFVMIRNEMVIIATGLTGAASVARGVGEWFGLQGGFDAENPMAIGLTLAVIATFLVVAIAGIWFQWGRYRRLNLYGGKAPAPTQPAVTRSTPIPVSDTVGQTAAPAVVAAGVAAGAAVVAADKSAAPEADAGVAAPTAGETPAEVVVAEAAVASAASEELEPEGEAGAEIASEAQVDQAEAVTEAEAVVGESVRLDAAAAAVATAAVIAARDEEPVEVAEAPAEVAAAAEEVAEAPAEVAGAVAALGVVANKVEDVLPTSVDDDEAVSPNIVEEVVKEIKETYSLDDIAKFKEKLEFVEGIGPAYAEKLVAVGVNTVLDLLQRGATRKGRVELVEATGITGKLILRWVNHADLYRIKGVGSEYADLLEAAGVDTVVELSHRNPTNLLNAVLQTNEVRKLVRKEPVASQVEDWVAQAKTLPRVVQY